MMKHCIDCGTEIGSFDAVKCTTCNEWFCFECTYECSKCGKRICNDCAVQPSLESDLVCKNCSK